VYSQCVKEREIGTKILHLKDPVALHPRGDASFSVREEEVPFRKRKLDRYALRAGLGYMQVPVD
jgi:hypothetical protein